MLKKAPKIHPISNISFPNVEQRLLKNGMPLALIDGGGDQEICFLNLAFHAGRSTEQHQMDARATAYMMKEGTNSYSSSQISEKFDFHGSHMNIHSGMDYLKINLFCLTKHLEEIIPVLHEILIQPSFPIAELDRFKQRSIEKLKEQLKRTEIVSYRELTGILYGDEHPYGYNSSEEMIKNIQVSNLKNHYNSLITANNGVAVLTGKISDKAYRLIEKCLEDIPVSNKLVGVNWSVIDSKPLVYRQKMNDALQTSIRIGIKLFDKSHHDYDKMYITNMVLGGYFGSRLSLKIREEMGLVYGIHSHMDTLKHDGTFYINTETSHDNVAKAKKAIFEEIKRISEDKISQMELDRAKNYLLGRVLYMVNGTFELSQTVTQALIEKKDPTHIINRINSLKSIDRDQILEVAQKYLANANYTEVYIGA